MADTKLSALTALAVEPDDLDEIYINDGGVSKKITYGTLKAALVLKELFDANTILAADTDNTPAALTVAEQTIVGRITAGNIVGLTAAQVYGIIKGQIPIDYAVAVGDETSDLTTGTGKLTFRIPHAITLTDVRASVKTAPTGSTIIVDINESGTTILSTKLTIDATEKTSETAAVPPVISDSALADDAEITIDIDQVGSTIAGVGLKVTLIGTIT